MAGRPVRVSDDGVLLTRPEHAPAPSGDGEGRTPAELHRRYFVFCESPEKLQDLIDRVQYYDLKDTIVIPPAGDGDRPTVCVIMEDPDERTRITLERVKRNTREATSSLLRKTGLLLEEWADRLSSKKK